MARFHSEFNIELSVAGILAERLDTMTRGERKNSVKRMFYLIQALPPHVRRRGSPNVETIMLEFHRFTKLCKEWRLLSWHIGCRSETEMTMLREHFYETAVEIVGRNYWMNFNRHNLPRWVNILDEQIMQPPDNREVLKSLQA